MTREVNAQVVSSMITIDYKTTSLTRPLSESSIAGLM